MSAGLSAIVRVAHLLMTEAWWTKVGRQLDWLCRRCEIVIVLAHSQGAEVSRHVIAARTRGELKRFISFGSGVKMLGVLTSDEPSRRHVVCAVCALVILPLFALGTAASGTPTWHGLLGIYSARVLVGMAFLDPPVYNPTFRASVPMTISLRATRFPAVR